MNSQIEKILHSSARHKVEFFFRLQWMRLRMAFYPSGYVRSLYRKKTGNELNLTTPTTFQEKLNWMKVYYDNPLAPICLDKYRVRTYLESLGLAKLLNACYGIYPNFSWIDFEELPDSFSLVATHGKNWRINCSNKENFDFDSSRRSFNKWIHRKYHIYHGAKAYNFIKPRIMAEKLRVDKKTGKPLNEYAFLCFNGKASYCLRIQYKDGKKTYTAYDANMTPLPNFFKHKSKPETVVQVPPHYDFMRDAAQEIAHSFPYARVNFYDNFKHAIFASVELFEDNTFENELSASYSRLMGKMINLPEKKSSRLESMGKRTGQWFATITRKGKDAAVSFSGKIVKKFPAKDKPVTKSPMDVSQKVTSNEERHLSPPEEENALVTPSIQEKTTKATSAIVSSEKNEEQKSSSVQSNANEEPVKVPSIEKKEPSPHTATVKPVPARNKQSHTGDNAKSVGGTAGRKEIHPSNTKNTHNTAVKTKSSPNISVKLKSGIPTGSGGKKSK